MEGERQEGGGEAGWGRKGGIEAGGEDTVLKSQKITIRIASPYSASEWISLEVTELGSPQMSQTSGEETQGGRHLPTPPPCHWKSAVPSRPAGQGRALDGELPLKGTSPPCHIYEVTDSTAPEKKKIRNEILTT